MSWWIVGIAIAAFFFRYVKVSVGNTQPHAAALQPAPAIDPPPPLPDDIDEYDVVGESHYQRQLLTLFGPKGEHGVEIECAATLTPEPSNPHDKNAVRCEISGLQVGYLGRDDAKDFSRYLRRKKLSTLAVAATVRGGWKNAKGEGHYGVTIQVPAKTIE